MRGEERRGGEGMRVDERRRGREKEEMTERWRIGYARKEERRGEEETEMRRGEERRREKWEEKERG